MANTLKRLTSFTLQQKGLIIVTVPLLVELSFIVVLSLLLFQSEQAAKREIRAKDLTARTNFVFYLADTLCKYSAAYLTTRERMYLKGCLTCLERMPVEINALRNLVKDNQREAKLMETIESMRQAMTQIAQSLLQNGPQNNRAASESLNELWRTYGHLSAELHRLLIYESLPSASQLDEQGIWRERIKWLIFAGIVVNVSMTIGLAVFLMTGIVNRLKVMTDNTAKLKEGETLNPPIGGQDEIATLDSTFHQMADALVEAMRKERAVIENTVDIICTISEDGTITKINHAAQINWGYDPQTLVGSSYKQITAAEDVSKTERSFDELLKTKSVGSFENRVSAKDGSLKEVLWSVHYAHGEKSFFCVVHDISERKELERLKQDFVAMVSHDLRTPLTSLQGGLALLSTGKFGELNDRGTQLLEGGERSIDRLVRLINDLLDIEKLEAGKFDMSMKLTKLSDVFDRALTDVKSLADKGSVSLKSSDNGLEVYADRERLVQVLVNLVGNAIKFSPAGSAIEVSAHESDGWIEVKVCDQGPGIPAAYKDAVFDRYRQLPGGQAKKGSTGLGLAICKVIVEQHGGIIGVDSQEGQGSTFWFRLPSGNPLPE